MYANESGALFNALATIFACLVKQYALKQTALEADWLLGANLFVSGVKAKGIHSLAAPGTAYDDPALGKDPQPSNMNHYLKTAQDNGGVHINSGIPGHAFYLTAVALGGYAWERAGRIWYETLCDKRTKPNSTFRDFAQLTATHAQRLFGNKSAEADAIRHGWEVTGVRLGAASRSAKRAAAGHGKARV